MKTNEIEISATEITLTNGEKIKMGGPVAKNPAQEFVRVSKNIVAGIEIGNTQREHGRVRFFRNLGTVYEYVGYIFIQEEGNHCVLFDICVSQPESAKEFVQKALEIQKAETDFLQRKEKSGDLNNQMKILARPHCA